MYQSLLCLGNSVSPKESSASVRLTGFLRVQSRLHKKKTILDWIEAGPDPGACQQNEEKDTESPPEEETAYREE